MKPEDFHIYKERALTGNLWMNMDINQQLEIIKRLEENCFHNQIMRMYEEELQKHLSFEKVYIRPARQSGRSITYAKLLTMAELLKVKGE